MNAQPPLDIPIKICVGITPEMMAGLQNGTLALHGMLRSTDSGQVSAFLDLIDRPTPVASKALVAQLASASKGQKSALVIAGLGVGVVLVGGAFAASYVKKKRAAVWAIAAEDRPECVINFEASLRAYVHAGVAGTLDATLLDKFIVDLDAVKGFMEEGNEVLISLDNLVPLFDLVIAHTPKLAAACGVDLPEVDEDDSEGGVLMPLRRHLHAQKTILAEEAA